MTAPRYDYCSSCRRRSRHKPQSCKHCGGDILRAGYQYPPARSGRRFLASADVRKAIALRVLWACGERNVFLHQIIGASFKTADVVAARREVILYLRDTVRVIHGRVNGVASTTLLLPGDEGYEDGRRPGTPIVAEFLGLDHSTVLLAERRHYESEAAESDRLMEPAMGAPSLPGVGD